jgi:hypothetical protein
MDNKLVEKYKRQNIIRLRDNLAEDLKSYLDEEKNEPSMDDEKLTKVSVAIGGIQAYRIVFRYFDNAELIDNPLLVTFDNGISNIILNEETSSRRVLDVISMYLNNPNALISEKEIRHSGFATYNTDPIYNRKRVK